MSLMVNSTMNVGSKGHFFQQFKSHITIIIGYTIVLSSTMSLSTNTSLKFIGATQNRDEAIILAIHKHIHK